MAEKANFESINVFASNHDHLPEATEYELSDMDLIIPGNHTTPCVVYPFDASKKEVVENLRRGLQNVLVHLPFIGGKLMNKNGRLSMVRKHHEPVTLGIHHLEQEPSMPTYESLAARDFPCSFFSEYVSQLIPPGANFAGFRRDDGCPIAAFQVNFIDKGLILTLPFHHCCGDAKSIDHIFHFWAASSQAAAQDLPMPAFTPSIDRKYFNATENLSKAEIQAKKARIDGFVFSPITGESGQRGNEPPTPPPTNASVYHFSRARCEELKRICWPGPESAARFVSSYDVLSALTWRCMMRARLPFLNVDPATAQTIFSHPVDSRNRIEEQVPKEYFGNGFGAVRTRPFRIAELIGDDGLPQAAQAIRAATQSFTDQTIPDLVDVRRAIDGVENMRWEWKPEDVMATSWTGMRPMQSYDFGFGLPVSLRLPVPPYEGSLGVLPTNRIPDGNDGLDMYVVLEEGCQRRLRADPEFTKYASVI